MRWMQSVGSVRISTKTRPVVSDLSGDVGLVCGIFRGIFSMGIACEFTSECRLTQSDWRPHALWEKSLSNRQ